jgi:hypothetical protein
MSVIDITYINLLSNQVQKFSKKKDYLYNLRCPYCGDSSKNKNKARGYFYRVKNDMFFKCHNCGVGKTLGNFLKDNSPLLYDKYVFDRYKSGLTGKSSNTPNPTFKFDSPKFTKTIFSSLPTIESLEKEHVARKYIEGRKIPKKFLSKLYYAEDFSQWASEHNPEYAGKKNDKRIVIPFLSEGEKIYGYQGRSLDPKSNLRYITTTLDPKYPKIYGLDSVKTDRDIYITEGPFDSMFLDNSIAMGGSDVNLDSIFKTKQVSFVFVFDNEPRNKQIVEKMQQCIDAGYSLVIWPSTIEQKDINDMVIAGINPKEIVQCNSYSGLEAKVKLMTWKKV